MTNTTILTGTIRPADSTGASLKQRGLATFYQNKIMHANGTAISTQTQTKEDLAVLSRVAQKALLSTPKESKVILKNVVIASQSEHKLHTVRNWLLSFTLIAYFVTLFSKKLERPVSDIQDKCQKMKISIPNKEEIKEMRQAFEALRENDIGLISGPLKEYKFGQNTYLIGKGKCLLKGEFPSDQDKGHVGQAKGKRRFHVDIFEGRVFLEFSTKQMQEQTEGTTKILADVVSEEKQMIDRVKGRGITPEIVENDIIDEHHCLIMEYCEEGDLQSYLKDHKDMSRKEKLHLSLGVIKAVKELHDQGIVHNDIKPANFVITRDPKGKIIPKLIDFGVSATLTDTAKTADIGLVGDMLNGLFSENGFPPSPPAKGTLEHVFYGMAMTDEIDLDTAGKLLKKMS